MNELNQIVKKELKIGDKVVNENGMIGEVIGILSKTPPRMVGPVVILLDESGGIIYRDIYGGSNSSYVTTFTKAVKKEKIRLYINIYHDKNRKRHYSYSHLTEAAATDLAKGSRHIVGVAVPFDYEYEVED